MNTLQQKTGGDGINPAPILKFTAIDDAEPLVVSGKGGEMTPTTLNWEKEFDEEFHIQSVKTNEYGITEIFPIDDEGRMLVPDVSDLKAFISQLLESQKQEYVQKVEELDNKSEKYLNNTFRSGYRRSIEHVISLLTQKKEDNESR